MTETDELIEAERRLQTAQLTSDVAALDGLLHPLLTFVGPDGSLSDKTADLEVHRTGRMRVERLEPEDLVAHIADGVGITVLTAQMRGEYLGESFTARMRYTRCWARSADGWRVVAAHASMLAPAST
jgi:hypothetical protein